MAERPAFSIQRDLFKGRLAELADKLDNPANLLLVQSELKRLARG